MPTEPFLAESLNDNLTDQLPLARQVRSSAGKMAKGLGKMIGTALVWAGVNMAVESVGDAFRSRADTSTTNRPTPAGPVATAIIKLAFPEITPDRQKNKINSKLRLDNDGQAPQTRWPAESVTVTTAEKFTKYSGESDLQATVMGTKLKQQLAQLSATEAFPTLKSGNEETYSELEKIPGNAVSDISALVSMSQSTSDVHIKRDSIVSVSAPETRSTSSGGSKSLITTSTVSVAVSVFVTMFFYLLGKEFMKRRRRRRGVGIVPAKCDVTYVPGEKNTAAMVPSTAWGVRRSWWTFQNCSDIKSLQTSNSIIYAHAVFTQ